MLGEENRFRGERREDRKQRLMEQFCACVEQGLADWQLDFLEEIVNTNQRILEYYESPSFSKIKKL